MNPQHIRKFLLTVCLACVSPFLAFAQPVITTQPLSQIVVASNSVTFSVTASGAAPLNYLWSRNGVAIAGASASSYTTNSVQLSDSGSQFICLVINASGTALSSAAVLTVVDNTPGIIVATTNAWNGVAYESEFGTPNTGTYGQTFIPPPQSSVLNSFTIYIQNQSGSVNFKFYIMAWNGSEAVGPILYQSAETSTAGISGFYPYTFDIGNLALTPGTAYVAFASITPDCTGLSSMGSTTSTSPYTDGYFVYNNNGVNFSQLTTTGWTSNSYDLAFVAVFGGSTGGPPIGAPIIATNPQGQSVAVGSDATLSVAATGAPPLSYQWYFNGAPLPGQTSTNLLLSANALTNAGFYTAVVSNLYGSVASGSAFLQVLLSPLTSFAGADGQNPYSPLLQANDGSLYGTTANGGTHGQGTVFRISTNGSLAILYAFSGGSDGGNSLGAQNQFSPSAGLLQATDGYLYGTTAYGGTDGYGTVFRISTNGLLTTLHEFTGGNDGGNSTAGLIQASDGNLYGTTAGGDFYGTLFRIATNGALTTLYSFNGADDGAWPQAPLMQAGDGYLYGTASGGGTNGLGTVFRVSLGGDFNSFFSFNGTDGSFPEAALLQGRDGSLYGTTTSGIGHSSGGTVFRISTNGVLHSLYLFQGTGSLNYGLSYANGSNPSGNLIQASDGSIYGTAAQNGGINGTGAIFRIATNGALALLYSFTYGYEGAYPYAGLIQGRDGSLYGTASAAGNNGYGTVFNITTNGTLTTLHSFAGVVQADPVGSLLLSGGNLYGATQYGAGFGTVFAIPANGVITSLYSFSGGNDGADPFAGLIQSSGGSLYGTTSYGGTNGNGTVFRISTNGAFTSLYSFNYTSGANPDAALLQASDGNLYGTTESGGGNGDGTVFRISTNGAFTSLYSFNYTLGGLPYAGLIQSSGGLLFGTTAYGGANGDGTVFRISTDGAFTSLFSFSGANGQTPMASLLQASDGNLYGTTQAGGAVGVGFGTIFRISTNGAFKSLYSFTGGSDGASPNASLIQADNGNLYGTTTAGGFDRLGTVFQITTAGAFTSLYSFSGGFDGGNPSGGLVSFNRYLYGVTQSGGANGNGAVFQILILPVPVLPVAISPGFLSGGSLIFGFPTALNQSYTVLQSSNLGTDNWLLYTNFSGNGLPFQLAIPATGVAAFFRVTEP